MRESSGCGTGANETRHWWLAMTSELSFCKSPLKVLAALGLRHAAFLLRRIQRDRVGGRMRGACRGLAPMALLAAVLSAVNDADDEMSKLDRVPTVERLSRCWLLTLSSTKLELLMSLEGRALPRSPMGASGAEAQSRCWRQLLEKRCVCSSIASFFSAPTASTIPALARLPPKALGMNALTLGGKRDRIEVNLPGSEDVEAQEQPRRAERDERLHWSLLEVRRDRCPTKTRGRICMFWSEAARTNRPWNGEGGRVEIHLGAEEREAEAWTAERAVPKLQGARGPKGLLPIDPRMESKYLTSQSL